MHKILFRMGWGRLHRSNRTRVPAPDLSSSLSVRVATSVRGATMTGGTQSSTGDSSILMPPARTTGPVADLRCKMRVATWNVMSLSGTGYQEALVCELARLNISIAGIPEAGLLGSDCCRVDSARMLHSGGDQHTNGVALLVRHPFDKALTSWKPVSDRLLFARFVHKHGHLSVIVAYAPTEPSGTDDKDLSITSCLQSPRRFHHVTL